AFLAVLSASRRACERCLLKLPSRKTPAQPAAAAIWAGTHLPRSLSAPLPTSRTPSAGLARLRRLPEHHLVGGLHLWVPLSEVLLPMAVGAQRDCVVGCVFASICKSN